VQTNPRPTPACLREFYSHHYHHFYQGVTQPSERYVQQHRKDKRLAYTVRFLMDNLGLGRSSRLLDYGCGEGSLFVALRAAGYDGELMGVEPDAEFARFAGERGAAKVFTDLQHAGDLTAVVFNHSLEHLSDPLAELKRVFGMLRPGGHLYVDVPDVETYTSPKDLHIAHVSHFSVRTLWCLAESAGFDPIICEKHEPPNHPKSVRLVAQRGATAAQRTCRTDATTEAVAWARVQRVEQAAWKWIIPLRLARVPAFRRAYRAVRGAIRSGTG
jgi:SAM-dependent methyltransferase